MGSSSSIMQKKFDVKEGMGGVMGGISARTLINVR